MRKEILVVLGSPNSSTGKLSIISISRLDGCLQLYSVGKKILLTGGWGKHFNTAAEPHAFYAKNYLRNAGVHEKDLLEFALSGNTVEDAVKIKPIISRFEHPELTIITSDYHLKRARIIFNEILMDYKLNFVGVPTKVSKPELDKLIDHEQNAINQIKKTGLFYDHIK